MEVNGQMEADVRQKQMLMEAIVMDESEDAIYSR